MTLILFASIPLLILLLFGRRFSSNTRFWLSVLSFPFFLLVMFYALILGVAMVIALVLLFQIRKWRLSKKQTGRQPIEIIYNRRDF